MKQIIEIDLKWYETSQNNSGGKWIVDDNVAQFVLVQASSAKEANAKMEALTEESGYDWCQCCGERWYFDFEESDSTDTPTIYGKPVEEYESWYKVGYAKLHHYSGITETVEFKKKSD